MKTNTDCKSVEVADMEGRPEHTRVTWRWGSWPIFAMFMICLRQEIFNPQFFLLSKPHRGQNGIKSIEKQGVLFNPFAEFWKVEKMKIRACCTSVSFIKIIRFSML